MKQLFLTVFLLFWSQLFVLSQESFSPSQQKLISQIEEVLDSHLVQGEKWGLKYHFYRPGLQKYGPYQWLWDSAFHMISWSRLNVTNSIMDLRTMLSKQDRGNFKIPEMIFWDKQSLKDLVLNRILLSSSKVTDITQMPMLSFSLKKIYEQTKDRKLLEQFLPPLIEYHQWWSINRQPDKDGKVVIIHPWQSGLDATPMYDEALKVPNPQPSLKQLYPRFLELELSYRFRYNWNTNKIIRRKKKSANKEFLDYFVVKDVGVNAVYTAGWEIYRQLSLELGNTKMSDYCAKNYQLFRKGLLSMFDQEDKRFKSEYLDGQVFKKAKANTVQSLFPLLLKDLSEEYKEPILSLLRDQKHYNTAYMVPTVSKSDPAYQPVFTIDLMWRGPSWAAPNYFILQGLKLHNQTNLYRETGQKWIKQALQFGVWEMWNPENGTGYGVKNLGMSTSVIDILYDLRT